MKQFLFLLTLSICGLSCHNTRLKSHKEIIKGNYQIVKKSNSEKSQLIGYVKDKETLNFLAGANILLYGSEIGTHCNQNGYFVLELDPGKIQISASNVGNSELVTKSIILNPKEEIEIHFYLGKIII